MIKKYNYDASKAVYNICTIDEFWIHAYDPETKQQSTVWVFRYESNPTKVIHAKRTLKPVFLVVFRVAKRAHMQLVDSYRGNSTDIVGRFVVIYSNRQNRFSSQQFLVDKCKDSSLQFYHVRLSVCGLARRLLVLKSGVCIPTSFTHLKFMYAEAGAADRPQRARTNGRIYFSMILEFKRSNVTMLTATLKVFGLEWCGRGCGGLAGRAGAGAGGVPGAGGVAGGLLPLSLPPLPLDFSDPELLDCN
ncbi:hypothetical protein EVAR_49173_1 [Eumeta japonica]|uniref:Mariner Mos1 transposase n=1 Tax=Eumeta variegata TaxID=151549 RepID=A0A4C1YIF5_EUMVA|nr:hypothetical protein EVAR_49173_1 [Eumeta japonica]